MILITRPIDEAVLTKRRCELNGFKSIIYSLATIHPVSHAQSYKIYDALIITSKNAILFVDVERYEHIPVFTVGKSCGRFLKNIGFHSVNNSSYNVDQLINLINNVLPCNKSLLYIRGKEVTKNLKNILSHNIDELITYQARLKDKFNHRLDRLLKQSIKYIMFYSTRTAQAFAMHVNLKLDTITAICISKNVANVLSDMNFKKILIASEPNECAMFELL